MKAKGEGAEGLRSRNLGSGERVGGKEKGGEKGSPREAGMGNQTLLGYKG